MRNDEAGIRAMQCGTEAEGAIAADSPLAFLLQILRLGVAQHLCLKLKQNYGALSARQAGQPWHVNCGRH